MPIQNYGSLASYFTRLSFYIGFDTTFQTNPFVFEIQKFLFLKLPIREVFL